MKHKLDWFVHKIGKRIYRITKRNCCATCKIVEEKGLIVIDKFHAECLFMYQNDLNLEYSNKKINS